jgi:hypothetical protein
MLSVTLMSSPNRWVSLGLSYKDAFCISCDIGEYRGDGGIIYDI